jgi:hypothetical protein
MLHLAGPNEPAIAYQILDCDGAVIGKAELPERQFEGRFLRMERIEADRDSGAS